MDLWSIVWWLASQASTAWSVMQFAHWLYTRYQYKSKEVYLPVMFYGHHGFPPYDAGLSLRLGLIVHT